MKNICGHNPTQNVAIGLNISTEGVAIGLNISNPRRCHWAGYINGFQPLVRRAATPRRCHWAEYINGIQPLAWRDSSIQGVAIGLNISMAFSHWRGGCSFIPERDVYTEPNATRWGYVANATHLGLMSGSSQSENAHNVSYREFIEPQTPPQNIAIPRRCHWAKYINGIQPLAWRAATPRRCHWAKYINGFQPLAWGDSSIPERDVYTQPNASRWGYVANNAPRWGYVANASRWEYMRDTAPHWEYVANASHWEYMRDTAPHWEYVRDTAPHWEYVPNTAPPRVDVPTAPHWDYSEIFNHIKTQ